jgi:DNA-binding NarL/FixJ family response regulator
MVNTQDFCDDCQDSAEHACQSTKATEDLRDRLVKAEAAAAHRARMLECLHKLALIGDDSNDSIENFLQETAHIIPPAFRFGDIACARIEFNGREYFSPDYLKTDWCLSTPIVIRGEEAGLLEVYYRTEVPSADEPVFVNEERNLLNAIASVAGRAALRLRTMKALETICQHHLHIFDGIDEPVYVADPNTYELLYANAAFERLFGTTIGQTCYRALQGLDAPCSFCTNDRIFGENTGTPYIWEFQNRSTGRWFRCIDRAIRWPDDRMVRYEMAIDITDRKQAEAELKEARQTLEIETQTLTRKDAALHEILDQIDSERMVIMRQVQANVDKILMPIVTSLESRINPADRKYVKLIERHLADITSPFARKLSADFAGLTPREVQICDQIKNGLSSKDIAELSNTSVHTVLKQRQRIRQKLGIANSETNLVSYLKTI